MTPGSPTPIVEETQQTTPVGMDIDVPEEGQGQQAEDTGNQVHPENPEEAPRVNGMTQTRKKRSRWKGHRQPCQNSHRREQWKMSPADQMSMQKSEQWSKKGILQ
jgi:hypothetical protein